MNLHAEYNKLDTERNQYLEDAERLSKLVAPKLRPRGNDLDGRPFTDVGRQGFKNLVSKVKSILFPSNVPYFRSDFMPSLSDALTARLAEISGTDTGEAAKSLDAILAKVDRDILSNMALGNIDSQTSEILLRVFVEGQIACHLASETELRVFPLRSFTTERGFNGQVRKLCIQETIMEDRTEVPLYTYVDYTEGKVYQQQGKDTEAVQVEASPDQYFVVSTEMPLLDNYAEAYGMSYYGTLNAINTYEFSALKIGNIAAALLLLISDPSLSPTEIVKMMDSDLEIPALRLQDPNSLQWLSLGDKVGDANVLFEIGRFKTDEIRKAFAFGVRDREHQIRSATEVLALREELDSYTNSIFTNLAETFQRPLLRAYYAVMGINDRVAGAIEELTGEEVPEPIQVALVAGNEIFARESQMLKQLNVLESVAGLSPNTLARLDGMSLYVHLSKQLGLEPVDIWKKESPLEQILRILQEADPQQQQEIIMTIGQIIQNMQNQQPPPNSVAS